MREIFGAVKCVEHVVGLVSYTAVQAIDQFIRKALELGSMGIKVVAEGEVPIVVCVGGE